MALDNTDILFASLLGSKAVQSIPRFASIQNELAKRVLPPIPFLPLKNDDKVDGFSNSGLTEISNWSTESSIPEEKQFFPFSFVGEDGNSYLLPYEPMISISGKNNIIKRNVAKARSTDGKALSGSIKERWNRGDYEITITGVLIGSILTGNVEQCYPRKDFQKLVSYMTAAKKLKVFCEPLQLLGINHIVIEDFSFPFTKGENVQAYEIKTLSDFDYKLLLKLDK